MAVPASRRPLSAVKRKGKTKVTPSTTLPADSLLLDIDHQRNIRVIYKRHTESPKANGDHQDTLFQDRINLFFFHGVGESADVWRYQIAYFHEKGYDIIAPDLLGHGLSSKPIQTELYVFDNLAQDVLYVFDNYKGKRNVIIGHSYGTSFCTFLARERSAQVSKVVLISGGGPTPLKPEKCSPFCFPLPVFHVMQPFIVRSYRRQAFHQPVKASVYDGKIFSLSSFVLRAVMQGQEWPEATEEYHADLIVPVLILQGRNDNFMSLANAQWMNETIYGSDLHIIDDAGHMVMMEQPDQVNQFILEFLSRDPSTKPKVTANGAVPLSQKSSLIPIDINLNGSPPSQKEVRAEQSRPSSRSNADMNTRILNAGLQDSSIKKTQKSKVLL